MPRRNNRELAAETESADSTAPKRWPSGTRSASGRSKGGVRPGSCRRRCEFAGGNSGRAAPWRSSTQHPPEIPKALRGGFVTPAGLGSHFRSGCDPRSGKICKDCTPRSLIQEQVMRLAPISRITQHEVSVMKTTSRLTAGYSLELAPHIQAQPGRPGAFRRYRTVRRDLRRVRLSRVTGNRSAMPAVTPSTSLNVWAAARSSTS